ncbi:toll/interleukin-1 receptor domain-containing protein [Paenibacillus sp. NPDC058910]|uniref:toll/interleukin-1 receptor domain-containing protein n=1 Tax=unclassified Paenibacillus TaxID=185978 RepID=UPI0036B4A6EF
MTEELYNLFISGDENAWESDTKIFDKDRCLREYTEKDIVEKFGKLGIVEINEIKKLPCIFAYEDYCNKDASIGYITDIIVRQVGIKISFQKVEVLSIEDLHRLQFELDIKKWEFNRTHWAIKKVNLYKELQHVGISLNSLKTKASQIVDITRHFFDVSFTFAGESRYIVEQVVNELGKIRNMDCIFYDNNYISQLARPSLDILLQDIYRNRSKLIVVFLSEKYQEKKWCGLEFRAIREMIMEKAIDRIMYIRLDAGHVDGVFNTDGYVDGTKFTPQEIANFINERLSVIGEL